MKLTAARVAAFAAALWFLLGAALAEDFRSNEASPVRTPPAAPMWSGFYLGLNAGYSWGADTDVALSATKVFAANVNFGSARGPIFASNAAANAAAAGATRILPLNSEGFIGGGQIGFNWQFPANVVIGLEADLQGFATTGNDSASQFNLSMMASSIPGREGYIASAPHASKSIDYLGTVRGRLGYLVTPTLLAYATGGLAYGGVNHAAGVQQAFAFDTENSFPAIWSSGGVYANTHAGWTVGGGLEWMFWPNWSAKVEYLYFDLGAARVNNNLVRVPTVFRIAPVMFENFITASGVRFDGQIVRAGLNYNFGWGAPLAAN